MTEKLYYTDAYISEFEARVLSCDKEGDGYAVVLEKSAFFPEEGGQSADTGYIGEARVVGAEEKDGVIRFIREEDKRKIYQITPLGTELLEIERNRIERLYRISKEEF